MEFWDEVRAWGTLVLAAAAAGASLVQLFRQRPAKPAFTLSIWNEDDLSHDVNVLHGDLRNVGPGDARSLTVTVTRHRGKWWKRDRTKWVIDEIVDNLPSHTEHRIMLGADGSHVPDESIRPYKRGDSFSVLVTYYASHSSRMRRKRLRGAFTSETKSVEIY